MMLNLSSMLFIMSLMAGTIISISSNSWIGAWMGLEMNLMSFIPLMNKNKTPFENEAAMKYFLIQTIASIMVLFSVLANNMQPMESFEIMNYIIMTSLLMKAGAAPLHFWFPGVMQGLSWDNCFILMTWQKIAPMALISYLMSMDLFTMSIIVMCVMVGAIGGLNQTSIRKLMAYSSISHLGWMIASLMMSNYYWVTYFILYSSLNMAIVVIMMKYSLYQMSQVFNQTVGKMSVKFTLFISMLSLGGLPPFLGFLPKWIIIQSMVNTQQYMVIIMMVMTTLITLFFYLRIMFSAFTFMSKTVAWKLTNNQESVVYVSLGISFLGIPLLLVLPMM